MDLSQSRLSGATGARTAASACATTSSSCRWTICRTPPREAVANNIKGTIAIPHPYGRLQFGADLDLHFRTLIGTGCESERRRGRRDRHRGRLDEEGRRRHRQDRQAGDRLRHRGARRPRHDHARLAKSRKEYVQWASELRREERPINDLWVSTKCGESDTTSGCGANPTVGNAFDKLDPLGVTMCFGETTEITGGEHIVAARCRNDEVREKFMFMFNRYQEVIERHKTSDLSDSQPTKGNIAGGLTTIEEKALGNIQKIGRKCKVDGVLDKAEMPTGPGLWFMDSSSAAAEMVTLCAASGYVVHFFPTGQGNVIGNPILPVIKLCANPRTVRTMSEHIDVRLLGPAAAREEPRPDRRRAARVHAAHLPTAGSPPPRRSGHREFVLTRLYEAPNAARLAVSTLQVRVWRGGERGTSRSSRCRASKARRCSTSSPTSSASSTRRSLTASRAASACAARAR